MFQFFPSGRFDEKFCKNHCCPCHQGNQWLASATSFDAAQSACYIANQLVMHDGILYVVTKDYPEGIPGTSADYRPVSAGGGEIGPTGPQGPAGVAGPPGPQGIQGNQGL